MVADTLSGDAAALTSGGLLDGGLLDGNALDGNALDGNALDGNALDGNALDGNALDGNALDGNALDGNALGGNALGTSIADGVGAVGDEATGGLLAAEAEWCDPEHAASARQTVTAAAVQAQICRARRIGIPHSLST